METNADQSARLAEILAGSGVGDELRLRIVEWAEACLDQAYDEGRADGYGDFYRAWPERRGGDGMMDQKQREALWQALGNAATGDLHLKLVGMIEDLMSDEYWRGHGDGYHVGAESERAIG